MHQSYLLAEDPSAAVSIVYNAGNEKKTSIPALKIQNLSSSWTHVSLICTQNCKLHLLIIFSEFQTHYWF